jgi:hypothetical protein
MKCLKLIIVSLSIALFIYGLPLILNVIEKSQAYAQELPVFPGAEGFGTTTVAGSGRNLSPPKTTIYKINTLDPSNSSSLYCDNTGICSNASLKDCIDATGPRVCVFEISGYIDITGDPDNPYDGSFIIREPYITIAGQTAPSPGITIKGGKFIIITHDVLIQHLRIRVGDDPNGLSPTLRRGLDIGFGPNVYNVVVDHCSISWATDENIVIFGSYLDETTTPPTRYYTHDITISNSIISEGLHDSIHPEAPHSSGMLVWGGTNISILNNLFAHNFMRNPFFKPGNKPDDYPSAFNNYLVVNNIIYNDYEPMTYGGPSDKSPFEGSVVGNIHYNGPNSVFDYSELIKFAFIPADSVFYLSGNYSSKIEQRQWCQDYINQPTYEQCSDYTCIAQVYGNEPIKVCEPPVWISPLTVRPSNEAKEHVLSKAGARPADRDSVDKRMVNDVINGTGKIIDCVDSSPIYFPTGIAQSGTQNTITLANDASTYNDKYNGREIEITAGTGSGQIRQITDYDGSTKVATVSPDWDIIPDNTSQYRVINDCSNNAGGWPSLSPSSHILHIPENPNGDDDADGYTNLEEWLHRLAAKVEDNYFPIPIKDLLAQPLQDKIKLKWTCVPEDATYNIYRGTSTGGPYDLIEENYYTTSCVYFDYAVASGITYYYVIRWVNVDGNESLISNEASGTL